MKILILDDCLERHKSFKKNFSPPHAITPVYTADEAIQQLQANQFDAVFLDHDLGGAVYVDSHGETPTGYTVAVWLSQNPDRTPEKVYVHSLNPAGAANIARVLPQSILAPFLWTRVQ